MIELVLKEVADQADENVTNKVANCDPVFISYIF